MKNLGSNEIALSKLQGQQWAPRWWGVLLVGLALWIATLGATFLTGDMILLSTVVLLGSFLVPVTAVVWYLDHDPSPVLLKVGLIEEFVKGAAIVLLALGLRSYATRDGLVLGGAVGFGFAALESSGTRWPRCSSSRANTSRCRCHPSSSRSSFEACSLRLGMVSGRRFWVA